MTSDVPCPSCGAKPDAPCTFIHWQTKQRLSTFYHPERIQVDHARARKAAP